MARAVTPAPDGGYAGGNTAEGDSALFSLTSGFGNTAVGQQALESLSTGSGNTAVGEHALLFNTTGQENTGCGADALLSNTTGNFNTAVGSQALIGPIGVNSSSNTAIGFAALSKNSGDNNTAEGANALTSNSSGTQNTATGVAALASNTLGNFNTADGLAALHDNISGSSNTAEGINSLSHNTTGNSNVALGDRAGFNLTTGSNNIFIGAGVLGNATDANTIRIGNFTQKKTFIGGISGKTVANGVGVIVGTSGQLGTVVSSARFKTAIKPMDKTSEAILALKPVTFRYKHELDPDGVPQFGLVAEEVENVNPDLVVRDEEGKVMTVRYEAVNAMLLNEFLKEHRQVEEQKAGLAEMKSVVSKQEELIAKQQKQIEALTAIVQKVSDQIALGKPAPQLVANP
jgi:uncharacterized coiled-coil protein SlyX